MSPWLRMSSKSCRAASCSVRSLDSNHGRIFCCWIDVKIPRSASMGEKFDSLGMACTDLRRSKIWAHCSTPLQQQVLPHVSTRGSFCMLSKRQPVMVAKLPPAILEAGPNASTVLARAGKWAQKHGPLPQIPTQSGRWLSGFCSHLLVDSCVNSSLHSGTGIALGGGAVGTLILVSCKRWDQ